MGFIRTQYLHNYKVKKNSDILQKITYDKQFYTESQNRLCHDLEKSCNVETVQETTLQQLSIYITIN